MRLVNEQVLFSPNNVLHSLKIQEKRHFKPFGITLSTSSTCKTHPSEILSLHADSKWWLS